MKTITCKDDRETVHMKVLPKSKLKELNVYKNN